MTHEIEPQVLSLQGNLQDELQRWDSHAPRSCILFLDFDGVTHPDMCPDSELFAQLPLIEEVLLEFDRTEVVISSSWRQHSSRRRVRRRVHARADVGQT